MADVASWFPPGTDPDDVETMLAAYPGDPHRAAADAWDSYAASLAVSAGGEVTSVSTGVQSVTYASGSSPFTTATARADWHRARANVRSVQQGSKINLLTYADVHEEVADLFFDDEDDEDQGTIVTAEYPPIGG